MNAKSMAFLLPLLTTLFVTIFASDGYAQSSGVNLLPCSKQINTCTSLLYQHNNISKEQISTFYSVNTSQISPIVDLNKHTHYVVTAPCSCKQVNSTSGVIEGYFYSTVYTLQPNDTFVHVSDDCYSGQAWKHGGEEGSYQAGEEVQIDLLCGCLESECQIVVTYTVQRHDTLSGIATLLSSKISEIEKFNSILSQNPGFLDVGWVLFVPMEKNVGLPQKAGE
ncbi:hypothetical protein ACSBR2_036246 [Camellia fascicularis]